MIIEGWKGIIIWIIFIGLSIFIFLTGDNPMQWWQNLIFIMFLIFGCFNLTMSITTIGIKKDAQNSSDNYNEQLKRIYISDKRSKK